jgi:ribonuclease HI
MKSLKINHDFAQNILNGKSKSTWRINDDKDLHVNDTITLIDKVKPNDPGSYKPIGTAVITNIVEKQIGQIVEADMVEGEEFTSTDDLIKLFRTYYGPHVEKETPIKLIRFDFLGPIAEETTAGKKILEAKLFGDGGSRGNPGPSAYGFVIYDMADKILVENGGFLGITTNNQAEYQSLKVGLETALNKGITTIHVSMDSLLVINQMKRIYKVKNVDLIPLYKACVELAAKFDKITFSHVPRERNKKADSLVNQVLDTVNDKKVV